MKTKWTSAAVCLLAVSILSVLISSCGAGQLFGPTATPTSTLTPTVTPTPIPVIDGVLQIPLAAPLTLGNGDLIVTVSQVTTRFMDIDDSIVLSVIPRVTGENAVAFGRCDASGSISAKDLELMRSLVPGGVGCLILTVDDEEEQPLASASVSLEDGVFSQKPEDLKGEYGGPDSLKVINPGDLQGYYLVFRVPNGVPEVKIRLEIMPW